MFVKRLTALLLSIVALVCFVACGGDSDTESTISVDPNDPFTGRWAENRPDGILYAYTFNGDGNGLVENLDIVNELTYTYDETTLYIKLFVQNPPIEQKYEYRIEGNNLYLSRIGSDGTLKETCFVKQ